MVVHESQGFAYTHPLINHGGSRVKTDPENQRRIEMILDRFWEVAGKWGLDLRPVFKQESDRAAYIFPIVGGIGFGLASKLFVHRNSMYIGKFFTLFGVYCMHTVANRYREHHIMLKYFENFDKFPTDIQKAIDNNDARYAYRWLSDSYKDIERP